MKLMQNEQILSNAHALCLTTQRLSIETFSLGQSQQHIFFLEDITYQSVKRRGRLICLPRWQISALLMITYHAREELGNEN